MKWKPKNPSELSQGTTAYYRAGITGKLFITDGINEMAEECQCFWVLDVVDSYLKRLSDLGNSSGYMYFNVKVTPVYKDSCNIEIFAENNAVVVQYIEFTDLEYELEFIVVNQGDGNFIAALLIEG